MCLLHPSECVCLHVSVGCLCGCVCMQAHACAHKYVYMCMHVFVKGEVGRVCVFGRVWTVFPDSSAVKNLPLMPETQEIQVQSLEKETATHSCILA